MPNQDPGSRLRESEERCKGAEHENCACRTEGPYIALQKRIGVLLLPYNFVGVSGRILDVAAPGSESVMVMVMVGYE